jgi:predicted DCC family thiol-disulfide oxidoreductase YuxK
MPDDDRTLVLYDDDCGFCRWSADKLRRWDRHGRLRFAAIQSATGQRALDDLPPGERLDSWHVITPDGRRHSSGAGVGPALEALPAGRPLARLAKVAPPLTEAAYRAVATRRTSIGRLLGTDACAVDPSHTRS